MQTKEGTNGLIGHDVDPIMKRDLENIEIPLKDGSASIEIDLNSLPQDIAEILDVLKAEQAIPEIWIKVAWAYKRNGMVDLSIELIQNALKFFTKRSKEWIDILSFYTSVMIHKYFEGINTDRESPSQLESIKYIINENLSEISSRGGFMRYGPLLRSIWLIASSKMDRSMAESMLRILDSINHSKEDLIALILRARAHCAKGSYSQAAKVYETILINDSNFQPDPRIGMGICKAKQGSMEKAISCLTRSLELNSDDVAALSLLAILFNTSALQNMSKKDFLERYKSGLSWAQQAYKRGTSLFSAIYVLCSYFFSKKKYENVEKLALSGLRMERMPILQSDSYMWLGRAYQNREKYHEALSAFQKSRNLDERNVSSILGMAQVQILLGDITNARLTLERVVDDFPQCLEAQLILCSIYASELKHQTDNGLLERAQSLFEKLATKEQYEETVIDSSFFIMYATILEKINPDKSLENYNRAYNLLHSNKKEIPYQIVNNMAVIQQMKGNFEISKQLYLDALESIQTGQANGVMLNQVVSIYFNIGRCEEQMGNTESALNYYSQALTLQPDYVDAKVRVCLIELKHPQESTFAKIRQLIESDGDSSEIRSFFGWYLSKQKKKHDEDPVQRHSLQTLRHWKEDTYALIQLGNSLLRHGRDISDNDQKRQRLYNKAIQAYDQALKIDPFNAYAAQGVAMTLAYEREFNKALMIFSRLREALNDISIYVNLGHCLLELKQYNRAIECYENALALNGFQDIYGLRSALGRAWLQRGRENKRISAFNEALKNAELALQSDSRNPAMVFNVAFVKFQSADVIRTLSEDKRTTEDLEIASKRLNEAIKTLSELANVESLPFSAGDLEQRLRQLNTTKRQLERAIISQREFEENNSVKMGELRKKREEKRRRKEELLAAAKAHEKEVQRSLAEERRKMLAEMETLRLERLAFREDKKDEDKSEEEKPRKKRGPKRKKSGINSVSNDDQSEAKSIGNEDSDSERELEKDLRDQDDELDQTDENFRAVRRRQTHVISEEFVEDSSDENE